MRKLIRSLFFLLAGVLLFIILQRLFLVKWNYPEMKENISYSLETFFSQEEGQNEVLLLGSSYMEYGFSPLRFYEQHGVTSYNLGISEERLSGGYYLLRQAMKRQKPSVVVVDISGLFLEDTAEEQWRYILDNMPYGNVKREMAAEFVRVRQNLGSAQREEKDESDQHETAPAGAWMSLLENDDYRGALIPFTRDHFRWQGLTDTDFRDFLPADDYFTGGYFLSTENISSSQTVDDMNAMAAVLRDDSEREVIEFHDGEAVETYETDILYDPVISDESRQWLSKIAAVCRENGSELLLTKIPSVISPVSYKNAWTDMCSDRVKEFAKREGYTFFDVLYDTDISIDPATDFADGGRHLNLLGAEKVTDHLGTYLVDHYQLASGEDPVFEEKLRVYKEVEQIAKLQLERNMEKYLSLLGEDREDRVIILSVQGDMTDGLEENDRQGLRGLGLSSEFGEDPGVNDSYIAVVDGGNVIYEASSNRELRYNGVIDGKKNVFAVSIGGETREGISVTIAGEKFAAGKKGLNIVVYDKSVHEVIDSAVCEFGAASPDVCTHTDPLKKITRYWMALRSH